jgi:hypothetical protein
MREPQALGIAPPLAAPIAPAMPLSLFALREDGTRHMHRRISRRAPRATHRRAESVRADEQCAQRPGRRGSRSAREHRERSQSRLEHRILGPALGNGLIRSGGDTWRMHRGIVTSCIDQGAMQRYAAVMITAAGQRLAQRDASAPGAALDVCDAMKMLTLSITPGRCFLSTAARSRRSCAIHRGPQSCPGGYRRVLILSDARFHEKICGALAVAAPWRPRASTRQRATVIPSSRARSKRAESRERVRD